MLEVTDTGTGMDQETFAGSFSPFQYQARPGHGTRLKHGTAHRGAGRWAASGPAASPAREAPSPSACRARSGAARYPRRIRCRAHPAGNRNDPAGRRRRERAEALAEHLAAGGYRVLEAVDGMDALYQFRARPARIDLLLTDVVMPGLNGRELARKALEAKPELKVIYMSGYTDDVLAGAGPRAGRAAAAEAAAIEFARNADPRSFGSIGRRAELAKPAAATVGRPPG